MGRRSFYIRYASYVAQRPPVAVIDTDDAASAREFVARLAFLIAEGYKREDIRVVLSVAKIVADEYRADPGRVHVGATIQGVRVI